MSHDTIIGIIAIAVIVGILFLAYSIADRSFPRIRMSYGTITGKQLMHPKASVTVKFSLRDGGGWKISVSIGEDGGSIVVDEETARNLKVGNHTLARYSIGRLSGKIFIHELKEV